MIGETTEIGMVALLLAGAGLSIERVTSSGGTWHCALRVDPAHQVDEDADRAEGSGPTLASAIEDARREWIEYRDRVLA